MTKKILKRSAILTAILMLAGQASFTAPPAIAVGSASLSLGDVLLRSGCPETIPINIDTGGEDIWAADVALIIGGEATVSSMELGSVLPMQACNDSSVPDIILCGARQAGSTPFNGQGVYGTINVIPGSAGVLSFTFNDETTHVINDSIQDALGEATDVDYNVQERFNVGFDGTGFCNPDTTKPNISVNPYNGKNNVALDTSVTLTLSDDRAGIDLSTLSFSVNGIDVDTFSFIKSGGTYTPPAPFELGEIVSVEVSVCDMGFNCRQYSGSFRTTPPIPPENCGNEVIDLGEECDDGYQTATCDRDCTLVACGDGVINDMAGEQCDDFNQENGDGCNSVCTVETPVEDEIYCPAVEIQAPVCPAPEEIPEEEIVQEIEPEITPPPPEIQYSADEIEEKAIEVIEEVEVIEETSSTFSRFLLFNI